MENFTSAIVDNITSTIISILTTELELNITDDGTTETVEGVLPRSATNLTTTTTPPDVFTITSIMENITSTTMATNLYIPKKSGKFHHESRLPGKMEAAVIICFVALVLFLAAKYIGCKPSYFCISCESCKLSRPRTDNVSFSFHRHENVLHRPEYSRPQQYAVYSRPATAHLHQMSTADARGYGYSGYNEEPQVNVYTTRDANDPPPGYDSLVPPAYNGTGSTGSSAPAYYTYETSRSFGDVRL